MNLLIFVLGMICKIHLIMPIYWVTITDDKNWLSLQKIYLQKNISVLIHRQSSSNEHFVTNRNMSKQKTPCDTQFNTLRPRQNGRHFADDIFKCISLNENVQISVKISLKFVPMGPIGNIPALVQKMAWRRPGDKPLSEPMMVSLPTHICVTRPRCDFSWNDALSRSHLILCKL